MRREWAGAKSQTNEEETHKRTNKQAGVGMCFSTICVCVHAAKDSFKHKKSTCASTLRCARRYKITEKENED